MKQETTVTKLVRRANGEEELLLRQARLAVRRGPDKGRELVIDRPRVCVGTAEDCDLRLDDSGVSRYHFEIRAADRGYLVRDLQPRLLRFLERQQVKRVGAAHYRDVDARVIAATNRRLSGEVEQGRFRQDLYYRLSVVRVEMPTLRERPEDILPLAHHFAAAFGQDPEAVIDQEISSLLLTYSWPGNVRELRNVVERLMVLPEAAAAQLRDDLPPSPQEPTIGPLANLSFHEARRRWQDIFERQYLKIHLGRSGGVVTRSADAAGLPRQTFNRLLRRHGISKE